MIIILILISLYLAWFTALMLLLLKGICDLAVCRLSGKPFEKIDLDAPRVKRWRRIMTAGVTAILLVFMLRPFLIPEAERTFLSPCERYALTIRFYPILLGESYRSQIILRDALAGETLGRFQHEIREVFLNAMGNTILWETCIRVEWDPRTGASDMVRVIFPDMNTAILMPSSTRVFPLTKLDSLDAKP